MDKSSAAVIQTEIRTLLGLELYPTEKSVIEEALGAIFENFPALESKILKRIGDKLSSYFAIPIPDRILTRPLAEISSYILDASSSLSSASTQRKTSPCNIFIESINAIVRMDCSVMSLAEINNLIEVIAYKRQWEKMHKMYCSILKGQGRAVERLQENIPVNLDIWASHMAAIALKGILEAEEGITMAGGDDKAIVGWPITFKTSHGSYVATNEDEFIDLLERESGAGFNDKALPHPAFYLKTYFRAAFDEQDCTSA